MAGLYDANGDFIDAEDPPDYDADPEEALDLGLVDRATWRSWPTWAKVRLLLKLRTLASYTPEGKPRANQYIDDEQKWFVWCLLGGRGGGKTDPAGRKMSEWGLHWKLRMALVGRTFGDVRDTMYEGETGLLTVIPDSELRGGSRDKAYNRSLGELYLANGSKFKGFSSEKPDQLRGPQHHAGWGDEFAMWDDAEQGNVLDTTIMNLLLGLRLPGCPIGTRLIASSTPKPNDLTVFLSEHPRGVLRVITTYDNLANLTEEFQETVLGSYEGTPVEAQELLGQIVDESTDAAWNLEMIAAAKVRNRPVELIKVVLSVDPAVSSKGDSDETGMAVVERLEAEDGKPWVHFAADLSEKMSAGEFPKKVLSAAHDHNADTVVVEINNGYDFVVTALTGYVEQREGTVIRRERKDRTSSRSKTRVVIEYIISADPCEEWPEGLSLVIKPVWQSKDKLTRAKAASVWWHRGRASHANGLKKAEKQMTTFDGTGRKSPDRLDALTAGVAGAMEGVRVGRPQAGVPTTETANPLPPEGDNKHALIASMASPAGEEGSIWEGRMW